MAVSVNSLDSEVRAVPPADMQIVGGAIPGVPSTGGALPGVGTDGNHESSANGPLLLWQPGVEAGVGPA
jgi:hypothetical protein